MQYVDVDGFLSETLTVTMGAPQGSTLGPLLFLIYINDLHRVLGRLNAIHFSDDTTLFGVSDSIADLEALVNAELEQVDEWLKVNRLSLNTSKTTVMLISSKPLDRDVNIIMRGEQLKNVRCHRFLGVLIDDKLKFNDHMGKLCNSLSQSIGVMRRVAHIVPSNVLRNLYFSLIYSKLTYAITAWGSATATSLLRIRSLVNRAARTLHSPPDSSIGDAYRVNCIFTFDECYRYFLLVYMFRIVAGGSNFFTLRIVDAQTPLDLRKADS
jgi:hypothetical protein